MPVKDFSEAAARSTDIARLIADFVALTARLAKGIPAARKDGGDGLVCIETTPTIDFDSLTRRDLKNLQPALESLHNLCRRENCAVEIHGLDFLPRAALTNAQTVSAPARNGSFMVSVDVNRPYNHAINPYSHDDVAAWRWKQAVNPMMRHRA